MQFQSPIGILGLGTNHLAGESEHRIHIVAAFQIGIPIHWGFVGVSADADPNKGANWLANSLTPFVGDANAYTPEFKAFLVNLEKI